MFLEMLTKNKQHETHLLLKKICMVNIFTYRGYLNVEELDKIRFHQSVQQQAFEEYKI